MHTTTPFPSFRSSRNLNIYDKVYTCGSCFAEELDHRLSDLKFQTYSHPFGIVFNPISMAQQFTRMLDKKAYKEDELLYQDGLFHSPDHHGMYSSTDPASMIRSLNEGLESGNKHFVHSDFLVITFGSAHHYTHLKTQQSVSNCHKIPQKEFTKQRASSEHILNAWIPLIHRMQIENPNLNILLSVSPVRYLKDGFIENQRSKANLLLAAESLSQLFSCLEYFPAYEIFMDDLREYRYVKEDLVHPNKIAVDYIWSYFEHAYYDDETMHYKQQFMKFKSLLEHRIINTAASTFKAYVQQLEHQLEELCNAYPQLDFFHEKAQVQNLKKLQHL